MSRPPRIIDPIDATFGEALAAIADEKKPEAVSTTTKPFLKWVGGKRSILDDLVMRMPAHYNTYREPFIGGGALFFRVQPKRAALSDINFHLMLTYLAVRDDLDGLIAALKIHQSRHDKGYFMRARKRLSTEKGTTKTASLLIYLNKTCFNGLYRVNKEGGFNVPMGSYDDPNLFDEDLLRADSAILQGVELEQRHFSQIEIGREDFFYLDPPYHKTYDGYNGSGFADDQHTKLAEVCRKIHAAGAFFMLSNSDTPFVRGLYNGFTIEQVSASRSVSCKGEGRGKENELIIRNYPA
jgi:DNA adenine methylase